VDTAQWHQLQRHLQEPARTTTRNAQHGNNTVLKQVYTGHICQRTARKHVKSALMEALAEAAVAEEEATARKNSNAALKETFVIGPISLWMMPWTGQLAQLAVVHQVVQMEHQATPTWIHQTVATKRD